MNIDILGIGHLISFSSFIRLYNGNSNLLLIHNNVTLTGFLFNELPRQLLNAVLFNQFLTKKTSRIL